MIFMIDFSKTKENVCYNDCKKCIHEFGKHKNCFNCNYYTDCMAEKEISEFEKKQDLALQNYLNRLENEEFPL